MFQPDSFQSGGRMTLAQALRRGRTAINHEAPPPEVWAGLQAALDAQRQPQRQAALALPGGMQLPRLGHWLNWRIPAAALGLLIVSLACLLLLQGAPVAAPPAYTLVPLVSEATLAKNTSAWLVPTEISQSTLAMLGAPFDPSAATNVKAELLVNAQGDVLAVRLPL